MSLRIADTAPDFRADTTHGPISFHDWLGDAWGILFSHPKDFTPVCTTELGYVAKLKPEFDKRGRQGHRPLRRPRREARELGQGHRGDAGHAPQLPDDRRPDAGRLEALRHAPAATGDASGRTPPTTRPSAPCTSSAPDKKIKLTITYPMTTGRNFDEILRVIDSLQLTAKHSVATPVNWKQGEDVIIVPSVSNDEAKTLYPSGWKQLKPYLRLVPQPAVA